MLGIVSARQKHLGIFQDQASHHLHDLGISILANSFLELSISSDEALFVILCRLNLLFESSHCVRRMKGHSGEHQGGGEGEGQFRVWRQYLKPGLYSCSSGGSRWLPNGLPCCLPLQKDKGRHCITPHALQVSHQPCLTALNCLRASHASGLPLSNQSCWCSVNGLLGDVLATKGKAA